MEYSTLKVFADIAGCAVGTFFGSYVAYRVIRSDVEALQEPLLNKVMSLECRIKELERRNHRNNKE